MASWKPTARRAVGQGGLFAKGYGTPGKAEVEAWMRQVTGRHAGAAAARTAPRNRAGCNGIARPV